MAGKPQRVQVPVMPYGEEEVRCVQRCVCVRKGCAVLRMTIAHRSLAAGLVPQQLQQERQAPRRASAGCRPAEIVLRVPPSMRLRSNLTRTRSGRRWRTAPHVTTLAYSRASSSCGRRAKRALHCTDGFVRGALRGLYRNSRGNAVRVCTAAEVMLCRKQHQERPAPQRVE